MSGNHVTVGTTKDKIIGMFLGIAIGDQLFMPVETFTAEEISQRFGRITIYLDPPSDHKWFAGQKSRWTDDTQLTLAIAESLIECGKIDMDTIAKLHLKSYEQEGDLGFGGTTRSAMKRLAQGVSWSESGISDNPKRGVGNGLPMKIAPIGAYCCSPLFKKEAQLSFLTDVVNLTLMTHRTRLALESTLAHIHAIEFCLKSHRETFNKSGFINYIIRMVEFAKTVRRAPKNNTPSLLKRIEELNDLLCPHDLISQETDSDLIKKYKGDCYVFNSLPFSYAFFLRRPTSTEILYDVGNAGGDTDTNASIVGGLLGALNGKQIFPRHLIDGLWQKDRIFQTAERFCERFKIR